MPISKTFFQIGAKSLSKYIEGDLQYYLCPICMIAYDIEHLASLTLEHVPQKSIGGKRICLTCVNCNNQSGHEIDAHLHKRERVVSFAKATTGKGEYKGTVRNEMRGTSTNANIVFKDNQLNIIAPIGINNPDDHNSFIQDLHAMSQDGSWNGQRFKIHLPMD